MKQFDAVPIKIPAKNVFALDHNVKATYNFDKLYPFLCQTIYPGDTWNCRAEVFMRAMPMLAPLMHNVEMRLYFFFVPYRLLWNENRKQNWKTFITGGEKGDFGMYGFPEDHNTEPVLPHFKVSDLVGYVRHGSLWDHMGFPSTDDLVFNVADSAKDERICSLPFRAYQEVYNEYFRNQNVQNEVDFSHDSGVETDLSALLSFRYKNWEKDYFTSCLPFAQRGQAMTLPIVANPNSVDVTAAVHGASIASEVRLKGNDSLANRSPIKTHSSGGNLQFLNVSDSVFINEDEVEILGDVSGYATFNASQISFSGLEIGTINDFRYCLRLQQWLENNARCGSRYIEQLLAHFGVTSSDARLQRPELLGGGKIPLLFTDVEQSTYGNTEDGANDDVLGHLGGKGTMYGKTNGFKKYFEEHGVLLGLLCIVPRTSYSQGVSRQWTSLDKTDWYFPEFAHLGEQAVLNKEVYFNMVAPPAGVAADEPNGVFGYQGRFTELRYIPSSVHGAFKKELQYWHLGRWFPLEPSLNSDFVTANTRSNIWAIETLREQSGSWSDPFVCDIHLDISAVRPMPKFAVPTL